MLESDWLEGAKTVRKIATAASVRARMGNKYWNNSPKNSTRGLGFDFLIKVFWFGLVWFAWFGFLLFVLDRESFLMGCVGQTAKAAESPSSNMSEQRSAC
jgi:hypothetical protein